MKIRNDYNFTKKWTRSIENHGFTMVPNLLLESIPRFHLTPTDICVIFILMKYQWDSRNPYPAVSTIANLIDKSPRTIQMTLERLIRKNVVRIKYRTGTTSEYDFTPLRERLDVMAMNSLPRRNKLHEVTKNNAEADMKYSSHKEYAANKTQRIKPITGNFEHISEIYKRKLNG